MNEFERISRNDEIRVNAVFPYNNWMAVFLAKDPFVPGSQCQHQGDGNGCPKLARMAPIPKRGSQNAPKFWRHEVGGDLAMAVRHYLREPDALTLSEIALMRAYVVQWIDSPAWDCNPSATAESIASRARRADGPIAPVALARSRAAARGAFLYARLDSAHDRYSAPG